MSDLTKSLQKFGKRLGEEVKTRLEAKWDELGEDAQDDIQAALEDYGTALLARVAGDPLADQALLEIEATVANWSFVGQAFAKRVVLDVLANAAKVGGELLAGIAGRLI